MPITPDQPFPKAAGNPIRSKDWNDLVYETQRLDTAKVNKAGDALTGPLTISAALNAAALGVGTTTPAARLHVQDGANPTVLRIQSTASFGKARVEMWSDPQGPNEWRPGYIESLDLGNWTGGLAFMTNGTTSANRTGALEALRVVNGKAGFGVPDPGFRIDVADRIRLRQSSNGTAGLWLFQSVPNADRAFIGMNTDTTVGFWGNTGAGWAFMMDTTTGNVGIGRSPSAEGGPSLYVSGRMRDDKLRLEIDIHNQVILTSTTNATIWYNVPNMSQTMSNPVPAYYSIRFEMGGLQVQGAVNPYNAQAEFRLLVDNLQVAYTLQEFHNNGWELRTVSLQRMMYLSAGTHTVVVQWSVKSPQAPNQATMRGGWYNDTRTLTIIEL